MCRLHIPLQISSRAMGRHRSGFSSQLNVGAECGNPCLVKAAFSFQTKTMQRCPSFPEIHGCIGKWERLFAWVVKHSSKQAISAGHSHLISKLGIKNLEPKN